MDVEPGQAIDGLRAEVTCNGEPATKDVVLAVKADDNTGGHNHVVNRPPGTLAPTSGSSPLSFSFTAPAVAGDHTITAKCTDGSCGMGTGSIWVGHKGLHALSGNQVYVLLPNNNDPQHSDSHNLTFTAASRMAVFAAMYQWKYQNFSVLQLNDASLERGGIFDLKHNWKSPHFEHCQGTAIDIRANGVNEALNITGDGIHTTDDGTVHPVDPMIEMLKSIAWVAGVDAVWEVPKDASGNFRWDARHFHTRLMGQEGLSCP